MTRPMAALAAVLGLAGAGAAAAADSVTPGAPAMDPPTLISLGVSWPVEGDEDRDAAVTLEYRRAGDTAWREGLPLLRLQGERMIETYNAFSFTAPNMFAGSVFDLEPGADYEIRLTLTDPDGVEGEAVRTLTASTRPEPAPAPGGRVFHVYPQGHEGEKQEPAFTGLFGAYYTQANGADWFNAFPPRVQPGDTILVHAGTYRINRLLYAQGQGTLFDGTYRFRQGGTAEAPIAIVAAGDGEVVFDGEGAAVLFDVMAADYLYFEGLTFRNADVAIQAGYKGLAGARGLTVKNSRFENVGRGIYTDFSGSRDFTIMDNVFIGRAHPDRLEGWIGATWQGTEGFPTPLVSDGAVKVYGPGHVIAHNYIANFHDGVAYATYGLPDDWPDTPPDRMPVSVDIYNNDISNVDDNCVEADGAMRNIRVLRNRCFNQAHRALSAQPVLGGPAYFIRNVVYHAPEGGALKLTADSAGLLVYQNTFVSKAVSMGPVANVHFLNNLILGQDDGPGVFTVETTTNYSSSDHNGVRPSPAGPTFGWTSPDFATRADFGGELEARTFSALAEYSAATGQDVHSVAVDYDSFVRVAPPGSDPHTLFDPADFDFALRPESPAVDAGAALPNITDGHTGAAPDLGAYESGREAPVYGPRANRGR